MAKQRGYIFSRRDIAHHACLDCGVNVIKAGNYDMLRADFWDCKLGQRSDDNLWIA